MAFVINKAEKISVFQPNQIQIITPGPGAYTQGKTRNKDNQYCAPFNTSQVKTSYFEVQQTNYGPGYYEPIYPKDVNKSDNNINSGYVFASRVDRFNNTQKKHNKNKKSNTSQKSEPKNASLSVPAESKLANRSLNQQVYQQKLQKSKSVIDRIRIQNNTNKVQSIKGKRQFIRVLLTSSTNTQNIQSRYIYRNIKGKSVGPGSYDKMKSLSKPKSVPKWELSKKQRFVSESSQGPGPGAYKYDSQLQTQAQLNSVQNKIKQGHKKLTSSFASTVIRSHMDTLIYNTNIPIKAAILQDKRIKDSRPGPGAYNQTQFNKTKKSFNYGCQTSFGCTNRNTGDSLVFYEPGPGSYQVKTCSLAQQKNEKNKIIKEIRNQIFGKKGKIASNQNKNNSLTRSYMHKTIADPNFTNQNTYRQRKEKRISKFCSLEQRCFSKLGNMSQQERFKNKLTEYHTQIGPGQYYSEIKEEAIKKQGGKNQDSVFKSGTSRQTFAKKNNSNDIPYYNVIRNDIGFRAQKMRRYIENLKKINIEKTPFQTSTQRFKQSKSQLNLNLQNYQYTQKQIFDQKKQIKQSSVFKSTTKRQIFALEERPGPGQYNSRMKANGGYSSLEKKSFNKYYGLTVNIADQNKQIDGKLKDKSKNQKIQKSLTIKN